MTVSTGYAPNSSTGNGVTTVFPYNFRVLAAADLEVSVGGVVKTLNVDYTVSGVGAGNGGNVTFTAAPAAGLQVLRRRNMALARATDYQTNGDLLADVLNPDQDAPVMMIQQVQEQVDRSLKIPLGESTTTTLPSAATRASKVLSFDASGNVQAIPDVGGSTVAAAASAAAAATSATAASASATASALSASAAELAKTAAQAARDDLNPLAYEYNTAFLIDATDDDTGEAVITKVGAAVTRQSLDAFSAFTQPVMIVAEDGTGKWAPHNLILQSSALSNAAYFGNNLSKTTGQEGPTGALDAAILTTTGTPASVDVLLSGTKISTFSGGYFLCAWRVKYDATHRWCFIRIDSPATRRVYFDLQSGVVGTADAGITGGISRYDADGTLLPSGWFLIYAYQAVSAASFNFNLGLSDADANPAVTVGKALRVAQPQTCYGVKPLDYLPTTTAAVYGTPYSWEMGGRSLMLYGGATYSGLWSEDLTNAVWTKTNCTAALNATGISGEPCSTLTATAVNATCTQVTVSAGTVQTFQPYIRRKTGTGAISITMDNGGSWTDITSQINSTTYTRVYLHGVLANPTVGFKMAASGDAIEVCHANNTKSTYVSPPLAVFGTAITMTGTQMVNVTIPVSLAGSNVLAYWDANLVNDTAILSPANFSGFSMSGAVSGHAVGVNETFTINDGVNLGFPHGTSSPYTLYGAKSARERIEATVYLAGKSGGSYCSINGEPPSVNYLRNVPTLDRISIGGSGVEMQFVRRLLIAPTTLADRDLVRTKHYQGGVRNGLYACAVVAGRSEFALLPAGTDQNRVPSVEVLKDYGDSVKLGVFWAARDLVPYNSELPTRLMQRNYVYDKVENTLSPVSNAAVIHQPSRWASHLGATYCGQAIRLTSGANAGRILMIFQEEDSVSGTLVDIDSNVYMMTNDQEGAPTAWSAATKIIDSSTIGSTFLFPSPGGDYVILPPNHPIAPNRIVMSCYADGNRVGAIYSDNFGSTWTLGTLLTYAAPGATETTLAMWPDGTLVMTLRRATGVGSNRAWAKSVNGGVSWVDQGVIPNITPDCDSSASTVQLDPSALTGAQGRIAMSHSRVGNRTAFQISYATDNTMELRTPLKPVDQRRYFGYSGLRSLFGGEYLACAVEYGHASSNLDDSVCLMVLKP